MVVEALWVFFYMHSNHNTSVTRGQRFLAAAFYSLDHNFNTACFFPSFFFTPSSPHHHNLPEAAAFSLLPLLLRQTSLATSNHARLQERACYAGYLTDLRRTQSYLSYREVITQVC